MVPIKKISEEVFAAEQGLVEVGRAQIEFLKTQAAKSARHRARLCAHHENGNRIHEMLIAVTQNGYIRPHKHLNKSESFHVIEGSATVIYFDEAGGISEVIFVGDAASGLPFYFRNEDERFHTQVITSPFLIFHEATNGPFNRAETVFAPWSPDETDPVKVRAYLDELRLRAARHKEAS
jgi:cupin fold WbuC family metalloprotein